MHEQRHYHLPHRDGHHRKHHLRAKTFHILGFLKLFPYTGFMGTGNKQKRVVFLLLSLLLIASVGGALFYFNPLNKKQAPFSAKTENRPQDAIAKVGEEIIYQQDLDYLTALLPQSLQASPAAEKAILTDQLTRESVILQGARQDNLISLDPTVYNSPAKDYKKRAQLVIQAQEAVSNQSSGIKGTVAAIWFNNPPANTQSKLTLTGRQALANSKISQLHEGVKDKKISMEQAAEQIRSDASLGDLDTLYKENASFAFRAQPDKQITTYPQFSRMLHSLKAGEVSDIYQAPEGGYLFGQVQSILTDRPYSNFTEWLTQKERIYQVVKY